MRVEIVLNMKVAAISQIVWVHMYILARHAEAVVHRLPVQAVMEAESVRSAAEAVRSRTVTNKGEMTNE